MKNTEIKELTTKELEERLEEEKNMLTRLRLNHIVSPLENPNKIKTTRRIIARLYTEMNKRKRLEFEDKQKPEKVEETEKVENEQKVEKVEEVEKVENEQKVEKEEPKE